VLETLKLSLVGLFVRVQAPEGRDAHGSSSGKGRGKKAVNGHGTINKKALASLPWKVRGALSPPGSLFVSHRPVTNFIPTSAHAALLRTPDCVVQLDCYEKMVNSFIHAVYSRPTATQMRSLIEWCIPIAFLLTNP
jgi:hypothetical protein